MVSFLRTASLVALSAGGLLIAARAVRGDEAPFAPSQAGNVVAPPAGVEETSGKGSERASLAETISDEVRAIFERVRDAVVRIEGLDGNGELSGSGFFIDPNGTILTSYSVGGDCQGLVVSYSGVKRPAKRLIADNRSGIALLQLEQIEGAPPTPFLPLAQKANVKVASPLMIVAYPIDMPLTPSFGFVAGLDLKHGERYFATTHIRANIPVQRGEGGAPLINMRGEAVGVVISGLDGGTACYGLPIEAASKLYHDYVRYGSIKPGWLGIIVGVATQQSPAGSFTEVAALEDRGPASTAGVQVGDILMKVGDFSIKAPEDILNASYFLTAGEKVRLVVWREGVESAIEVSPGENPLLETVSRKVETPVREDVTLRFSD